MKVVILSTATSYTGGAIITLLNAKQKMNSRLDSLMAILDIQGRKLNDFVSSPAEIDYKKVHDRLSPWVQRSQKYLLGCLEGIR